MSTPAVRAQFADAVAEDEGQLNLARAALLVAAEEYPQLSPEPYLQRLDLLAERVKDRLSDETAAPVVLNEISRLLFEEEGFRGNTDGYYDPRNSFLNDVLDRKLGIPLTLGFHSRPSLLVAKIVQHYGGKVELVVGEDRFDAGSVLDIQWAGGKIQFFHNVVFMCFRGFWTDTQTF